MRLDDRAITYNEKKEIVDKLFELWLEMPYLRFGQFLELARGGISNDLFYVEDFKLIERLRDSVNKYKEELDKH